MQAPGQCARHAIITDECRQHKGDAAVIEEAIGRLRESWESVAEGHLIGRGTKFHLLLMVERAPELERGPLEDPALTTAPRCVEDYL